MISGIASPPLASLPHPVHRDVTGQGPVQQESIEPMPAVRAGGSVRSLRRQTSCYRRRCLSMITARWSGTRLVSDLGCPPLGHGRHGLIASLFVPKPGRQHSVAEVATPAPPHGSSTTQEEPCQPTPCLHFLPKTSDGRL